MKPIAVYPPIVPNVIDLLDSLLEGVETAGVGADRPDKWTADDGLFAHVFSATPSTTLHPAAMQAPVQVTCYGPTRTRVEEFAWLCHGVLTAHSGSADVHSVQPRLGVTPETDPSTGAELAWFTVLVTVRSQPAPVG